MLYFKIDAANEVVAVAEKVERLTSEDWAIYYTGDRMEIANKRPQGGWLCRNDIPIWLAAEELAESASKLTGEKYLATDAGEYTSPRFDVIKAPKVGDDVSKGFNGDFYPMGKITKISDDFKRITVEGPRGKAVFYRRADTGTWKYKRMWSLVMGVHSEWNPEF